SACPDARSFARIRSPRPPYAVERRSSAAGASQVCPIDHLTTRTASGRGLSPGPRQTPRRSSGCRQEGEVCRREPGTAREAYRRSPAPGLAPLHDREAPSFDYAPFRRELRTTLSHRRASDAGDAAHHIPFGVEALTWRTALI